MRKTYAVDLLPRHLHLIFFCSIHSNCVKKNAQCGVKDKRKKPATIPIKHTETIKLQDHTFCRHSTSIIVELTVLKSKIKFRSGAQQKQMKNKSLTIADLFADKWKQNKNQHHEADGKEKSKINALKKSQACLNSWNCAFRLIANFYWLSINNWLLHHLIHVCVCDQSSHCVFIRFLLWSFTTHSQEIRTHDSVNGNTTPKPKWFDLIRFWISFFFFSSFYFVFL